MSRRAAPAPTNDRVRAMAVIGGIGTVPALKPAIGAIAEKALGRALLDSERQYLAVETYACSLHAKRPEPIPRSHVKHIHRDVTKVAASVARMRQRLERHPAEIRAMLLHLATRDAPEARALEIRRLVRDLYALEDAAKTLAGLAEYVDQHAPLPRGRRPGGAAGSLLVTARRIQEQLGVSKRAADQIVAKAAGLSVDALRKARRGIKSPV